MTGRVNGRTMILGSGNYFDFEALEEGASIITLEDLAWGLAFEGRWAGQCRLKDGTPVFYSDAQHCCVMAIHAINNGFPELAYPALHHEDGEALCGDMLGPLKSMCPDFKAIEKAVESALQKRFDVPDFDHDLLKVFDKRMMATERRDLINWDGVIPWDYIGDAQPFEDVITPWSSEQAAQNWLSMHERFKP